MNLTLKHDSAGRRPRHSPRLTPRIGWSAARDTYLPYLPGLDGLRAFAVVAVLLYHAEVSWVPGGYLGVEVFFVLSGYLITALLLAEWRQHGYIDLKVFWLRRARRLLPALFLLLAATLAFALVFLPDEVAQLRSDALAALGYVTNWHFVLGNTSYFETVGRPSLLQHLWSLAIEEQFYLLWPLLLTGGLRRWSRATVLHVVLLGAAAATALMALLYAVGVTPSRLYYGTDTRAAGLLIGAALAFVAVPGQRQHRTGASISLVLDVVGLAAFGALVWYGVYLDPYQPHLYQGGFAAVALATAVVIITTVHPRARLIPAVLEWWPLRWVGQRSYSLYLWHWPIFVVSRPHLDVPIDGLLLLLMRLAVTVVLADLSFRYIEMPFRRGALEEAWGRLRDARGVERWHVAARWVGAGGTIATMVVLLGMAVAAATSPPPPPYLATQAISRQTVAAVLPTLTPVSAREHLGAVTPAPMPQVMAIGDSVMISAAQELEDIVPGMMIDAAQARQVADVIDVLRNHRAGGEFGDVVVLHIGNNGPLNAEQFDALMEMVADVPRVLVVTVKVPRFWESLNNVVLREGVQRYANSVLVDWHAASVNRPEVFWNDGIHLRPEGARLYADLIANAISSP